MNFKTASKYQFVATVGLVVLLQCLVRPDVVLHPQFWAEDATEWFLDAYTGNDVWDLLRPYNGYLHITPRFVAFVFVGLLPLKVIPLAFNLVALVFSALCLSLFTLPEFRRFIPSDLIRLLTVCFLVLVNPSGEILGTITNAQWYAGLGTLQMIFLRFRSYFIATLEIVFLYAAALSTPTMIFLSIFVLPLLFGADGYRRTKAICLISGIVMHGVAARALATTQPLPLPPFLAALRVASQTGEAILSVSLLGYPASLWLFNALSQRLSLCVGIPVIGLACWLILKEEPRTRPLTIGILLVLGTYIFGISALRYDLFSRGNTTVLLASPHPSFDEYNYSRFLFIPFCLLTLLVLRSLNVLDMELQRKFGMALPALQLLFLATGVFRTAPFPAPLYLNWDQYATKIERGWCGSVPIQPTAFGWNLRIPQVPRSEKIAVESRGLLDLLTDESDAQNNRRVIRVGARNVEAFFQHPTSSVSVKTVVPNRYLRIIYGLDPRARQRSDGVIFRLQIDSAQDPTGVRFSSDSVSAKPVTEGWFCSLIDLQAFEGAEARLTFQTLPGPTSAYDWALWLDPSFTYDQDACSRFSFETD
jgi:hypothetical protein